MSDKIQPVLDYMTANPTLADTTLEALRRYAAQDEDKSLKLEALMVLDSIGRATRALGREGEHRPKQLITDDDRKMSEFMRTRAVVSLARQAFLESDKPSLAGELEAFNAQLDGQMQAINKVLNVVRSYWSRDLALGTAARLQSPDGAQLQHNAAGLALCAEQLRIVSDKTKA